MPAAPALKGAAALRAIAGHAPTAPAPAHHHHHDDDCGCGHAHVPAPDQVAGPLNWRRAGSAVLAASSWPAWRRPWRWAWARA
ncbi:hypothetical protein G6F31_020263 [Rhizopus arrhizus]|nr:hypothetical protein G6F31_020263 [Rhizopus arrhizus]